MTVAIDQSNAIYNNSVAATTDVTITPTALSDMVMVAFHLVHRAARTSGSMVFDPEGTNVAFTKLGSIATITSDLEIAVYLLKDADFAKGAIKTIRGTVAAAGTARQGIVVATFSGVDQTTSSGTVGSNGADGTSSTLTVTGATGDLVIDGVILNTEEPVIGASQTLIQAVNNTAVSYFLKSSFEPGAASVDMSWSSTGTRNYGHLAFALKQVAASGIAIPVAMHHYRMQRR